MPANMKIVILCGGKGTRLREETEYRPKPLVEIGNKPILWHIMKIYSYYGFNDFVLCLGYKGWMIKEYFLNYKTMNNDFTLILNNSKNVKFHKSLNEQNWTITFVDTGENTMTGARIKKIEKYIDTSSFMLTYGDGVANINIKDLVKFHRSHRKAATVTGVHPSSRFGELIVKKNEVVKFSEKPQIHDGLINGGFFIFNKEIFKYLKEDNDCVLEKEPLEQLSIDNKLMVYAHKGFWYCMDTYRDSQFLNEVWFNNKAPWKIW